MENGISSNHNGISSPENGILEPNNGSGEQRSGNGNLNSSPIKNHKNVPKNSSSVEDALSRLIREERFSEAAAYRLHLQNFGVVSELKLQYEKERKENRFFEAVETKQKLDKLSPLVASDATLAMWLQPNPHSLTFSNMRQKLKDQVGEQKAAGWIHSYGNIRFDAESDLELAASIKEQAELYMNAILLGETVPKINKDTSSAWQKILESCCEEFRHAITWVTCVAEKTKNISEIKKKNNNRQTVQRTTHQRLFRRTRSGLSCWRENFGGHVLARGH